MRYAAIHSSVITKGCRHGNDLPCNQNIAPQTTDDPCNNICQSVITVIHTTVARRMDRVRERIAAWQRTASGNLIKTWGLPNISDSSMGANWFLVVTPPTVFGPKSLFTRDFIRATCHFVSAHTLRPRPLDRAHKFNQSACISDDLGSLAGPMVTKRGYHMW